jgi:hypothetical protein
VRAVGIVLQIEVFVNSQKHLLLRHCFGEVAPARIVAERARGRGFEPRVRQFSIAINQIDFNIARNRLTSVDADGRVGKIRACFTIPTSELDDVDVLTSSGNEAAPEITCKPARLQFEFARCAQRKEQPARSRTRVERNISAYRQPSWGL